MRDNEGIISEDGGNDRSGRVWDIFWRNADRRNSYVKYELLAWVEARRILNFGLSNWVNGVLLK